MRDNRAPYSKALFRNLRSGADFLQFFIYHRFCSMPKKLNVLYFGYWGDRINYMKISLTDQFLLDLYDSLEKAGDVVNFVFKRRHTLYDVICEKDPVFDKYRKIKNRQKFNKVIYYLKKNNFIKVKNLEDNKTISLTKSGLDKALKASFRAGNSRLKKRQDGKWIMITFDIPKNHKRARWLLRSVLKNLEYKIFQYSVWITPYDVFEKTKELFKFYSLDSYVKLFLIEKI